MNGSECPSLSAQSLFIRVCRRTRSRRVTGAHFQPMDVVQELTTDEFAEIVHSLGVAVVYFWGTYCGPCRAMAPQFERAATLRPSYRFAKQNINEHRRPSFELGIHTVPTVAVFRGGLLLGARTGALDAEGLIAMCDELAAGPANGLAA